MGTKAHGSCVRKVLSMKRPTILCGGGGYKIENVARCWAYETGIALGEDLPEKLPSNLYFYDYYAMNPSLHISESNTKQSNESNWRGNKDNKSYATYNDKNYAERVINTVFSNLQKLENLVTKKTSLKSQVDPALRKYVGDHN